jgi:type II secretory ATPase GspE/PulE/Tfp pilus assembly ATPase PilB-like protein
MTMTSSNEARIGELLVAEGLITDIQLQEALQYQHDMTSYVPLGQLLVERKYITRRQLDLVLDQGQKRPRLGEVLIRSGILSTDQLDHALEQQKKVKLPLGQVLVKLGYVSDEAMRQALSVQLNIPFLDLDRFAIDRDLAKIINASYARRHMLVPVSVAGQTLTVAMDDPTHHSVIEELSRSTGLIVTVVTASREAIQRAFNKVYDIKAAVPAGPGVAAETLDVLTEEESEGGSKSKYVEEYQQDQKAGEIVRQLMTIAIERGCSDIHLETLSESLHVRFRVDGVLQELALGALHQSCNENARRVISRLKILAKLDIAERRRPQDGSFRVRVDRGKEQINVDLRVSVVPSYYGESVVLRILDRSRAPHSIDQLGFSTEVTEKLRQMLKRPTGILLITGPTGSGKSTTLYASLMTVYRPEIRILTAEDPIEYVYEQFSQSEVNDRIGNTFAAYLRAFLRHDPEVIMVGEIRDEETAQMAFRAAQTGHLLLSTLHTNSAIGAVSRLLDLSVDPNLVGSSIIGVLAQRLVRQVCQACKTPYTPSPDLLQEFFDTPPAHARWYKGRGCAVCNFSGYKGRLCVSELWTPNDQDIILISKKAPFDEIRESSKLSTISMARDVADRLAAGRTNLEELIRVLPYSNVYEFRQLQVNRQTAVAS